MEACSCWRLHQAAKAPSFRTFTYIVTGALLLWVNNVTCGPTTFSTPTELARRISELKIPSAGEIPTVTPQTIYKSEDNRTHYQVCRPPLKSYRFALDANLLTRLENCTVVEGNLEIIWMFSSVSKANYTDLVFPHLVEITGYLLLHRVAGLETVGQLFPNLRVIGGREKFYDDLALIVFENDDLVSLSLSKVEYIGGDVLAMVNAQLCYVGDKDVDWNRVIGPGKTPKTLENKRKKDGCDLFDGCKADCEFCWDRKSCQPKCKCYPSEFGPDWYNRGCNSEGECCHPQCVGGCRDSPEKSAKDCYVCRNFFHEGECMEKCPVENGEQLLEYDERRCLSKQECFTLNPLNKQHEGKCILKCPTGYVDHESLTLDGDNEDVRVCVKCSGEGCYKLCSGGIIRSVSNAKRYEGCTDITSFLEIYIRGRANVTLLNKYLSSIRRVKYYVRILETNSLRTLSFLDNLKSISGIADNNKLQLYNGKYALVVTSSGNLERLWNLKLNHNITIENGMMFFQRNRRLCYNTIRQALDSVIFKGIDPKTNKTITAASHDEFDVSSTTNGEDGDCFENTLSFNISQRTTLLFTFNGFDINEERLIIMYNIYYRRVREDETVTYQEFEKECLGQEDEGPWEVQEVDKSDGFEDENGKKVFEVDIYRFESFARYAAYVQTILSTSINMNGARSEIKYLHTKPSKPDPVQNIHAIADNLPGNIMLKVSWEPPESPNGVIALYYIYYKKIPWKTDRIDEKNFCDSEGNSVTENEGDKTGATTTVSPKNNTAQQCVCESDEEPTTSVTAIQALNHLRVNVENYIQDFFFDKNMEVAASAASAGNLFGKQLSPLRRRKRSLQTEAEGVSLREGDSTPADTNTRPSSPITTLPPGDIQNETTTTSKPGEEETSKTPSMASVSANQTSVSIFNLEPSTDYLIEIVACHAYNKTDNVTRCSKRAQGSGNTKPDPALDIIDEDSFRILDILEDEEGIVVAYNLTWAPPDETNGPILSYTFRWYPEPGPEVTDKEKFIEDNKQSRCIERKAFKDNNYTYKWSTTSISPNKHYILSVRLRTVGTSLGEWTHYNGTILIGDDQTQNQTAVVVSVSIAILTALVAIAVAMYFYKTKRKTPMPLTTGINSINPDYMEDVYIPDEWELGREKVKMGCALGQGSFGMVYEGEARDLLETDKKLRKVAIKTTNNAASLLDQIQFLNEASRMKAFKCHHIVQLLGVVSQGQPVLVIMELMALGDLKNYLRKHRPDEPDNDGRKPPTLKDIWQMAAEIADGMAYLTAEKFVHRDLAARNCMVSSDMTVKIGDFGMTRDIYDADYYRKGGKGMLPVRWMAPESLRDGIYTSKSDVWSYGVVLWEMATLAAQPYQGFSNEEVLRFVIDSRTMDKPVGCPNRLFEMMKQCWEYYPRYRPSFNNLIEQLQGDVKKNFFSVSWFYNNREDDGSGDESDSLIVDDDDHSGDTQRLNVPSSHHSSGQHISDQADDADLDLQQIEDDASLTSSHHDKDLIVDIPMRPPKHHSLYNHQLGDEEMGAHSPLLHGGHSGHHLQSSESDSEAESSLCDSSPHMRGVGGNLVSPPMSNKPASSGYNTGPPSYNTALDHPVAILPRDSPTVWSSGDGSKSNSCNGSANGHLHFGNQLTSAC